MIKDELMVLGKTCKEGFFQKPKTRVFLRTSRGCLFVGC